MLLDELASGVLPASADRVARDLALPAGLAAGGMITAFHVLALVVETPLLAWSERVPARWFSASALAVLALATLGAALAASPIAMAVCLALYGPASGCALAAAEGLLVESRPDQRERTLARLGLAGALGDLAVPALLGGFAWLGLGWRAAMGVAACTAALLALVHASSRALEQRLPPSDEDEDGASVVGALRLAFSTRPLVLWAVAATLTSLLDEVLVAFVVVRLAGAAPLELALAVGAWTVGVVGGSAMIERLADRLAPERPAHDRPSLELAMPCRPTARAVLLASAAVVAACLVVLASTGEIAVATPTLFVLGAATSVLHPLASARAYAALPGRPALVNAVVAALGPVEALAPLALGALALGLGAPAAILAILVAPLGIASAAWRAPRGLSR